MLQVVWNTFTKRMSFTVIWQLEIVFWKQHQLIQTKWISGYQILDFQSISMIIIKNTTNTCKPQPAILPLNLNRAKFWEIDRGEFRHYIYRNFKLFFSMQTDTNLPVRWLSPEVLESKLFTSYSDVWAFGILKWEMLTRCLAVPYGNINGWNGTFIFTFLNEIDISISDLMIYLKEGNRLQKPRHCDEKLYQTMMQCWAPDKRDRPRFTDLVKFFDEHHRNVTRNRSRIWVSLFNPTSYAV